MTGSITLQRLAVVPFLGEVIALPVLLGLDSSKIEQTFITNQIRRGENGIRSYFGDDTLLVEPPLKERRMVSCWKGWARSAGISALGSLIGKVSLVAAGLLSFKMLILWSSLSLLTLYISDSVTKKMDKIQELEKRSFYHTKGQVYCLRTKYHLSKIEYFFNAARAPLHARFVFNGPVPDKVEDRQDLLQIWNFRRPLQDYLKSANLVVGRFSDGNYVRNRASPSEVGDVVSVQLSNDNPYETFSIDNAPFHPFHVSVQKNPTETEKGSSINIVEKLELSLANALNTSSAYT